MVCFLARMCAQQAFAILKSAIDVDEEHAILCIHSDLDVFVAITEIQVVHNAAGLASLGGPSDGVETGKDNGDRWFVVLNGTTSSTTSSTCRRNSYY